LIKNYLADYHDIEIIAEYSDGFKGMKAIQELQPDFIFLDVQMPKLTGFEMLELLENPPVVIFTTAYNEYAIKAFDMNAVDYLLKPFSRERFSKAIEKAKEKLGMLY
jgi:two-component system LytT family response regulator